MTQQHIPNDYIYALDIGTRNVVGIIAHKNDDGELSVIAHAIENHRDRAMYDGQIHDIGKVQKIISLITKDLSEQTNLELNSVRIAAAGRALKTVKANVIEQLNDAEEITQKIINKIEAEGIQNAQNEMDDSIEANSINYYCVGYSTTTFLLDGIHITNPLGHKGKQLEIALIATFLPRSVVDSLYTAVDKAGLTVSHLTLEPIAALAISVPEKFRLLNIALVDVGAGTSDIAITKNGLISAYGMVDVAGDELTEALVNKYLLDFETAENLKVSLISGTEKTFSDIVGMTHTLSNQTIIDALEDNIEGISHSISEEIVRLNGGAPSAVFLIGGGSEFPTLAEHLATSLKLPIERVVIKPAETLELVNFKTEPLIGPKFITPLGIAYTDVDHDNDDFLQLIVNGSKVKLYNTKELKVLDALVLLGHNTRALLPQTSKRMIISVNGEIKRYKGEAGEPAAVKINGYEASLEDLVTSGDDIAVKFATTGKTPTPMLSDFVDLSKTVIYQGNTLYLAQNVMVNDELQTEDKLLKSGDKLTFHCIKTLQNLCDYADIDISDITVNGGIMASDYILQTNDVVEFTPSEDVPSSSNTKNDKFSVPSEARTVLNVTINGEEQIIRSEKSHMVFVDLFDIIAFDLTKPQGIIDLQLNGHPAQYMDELKNGDDIIIRWK